MTCVYRSAAFVDLHLEQLRRAAMPPSGFLISCARLRISSLVGLGLVEQALFAVLAGLLLQQRQQLDDDLAGRSVCATITMHRDRLMDSGASGGVVAQRGKPRLPCALPGLSAAGLAR